MRRLSRTAVPAFTFTMLAAVCLAHAQSTRSYGHSVASSESPPGPNSSSPVARGPKPVWVKVCGKGTKTSKNVEGGEEKTDVSMCVTYYQYIDGKGTLIAGAALREIDGQDKKHLLVHTPPDTQVRPATHAQLLPRDLWDSLQKPGKLVKSEEDTIKELTFASTSCNAFACAAELEATPALISDLEAGGGLVVFVTNPSGMTVARPIPLVGFAQALAGPSAEARAR